MFQYSVINALMLGYCDIGKPVRDLKNNYAFGLGAVSDFGGEVIVFDGKYFFADYKGAIHPLKDEHQIGFGNFFNLDGAKTGQLQEVCQKEQFIQYLVELGESKNHPLGVRFDGVLEKVHYRSVRPQKKKRAPLGEVSQDQSEFEKKGIHVTMIGTYFPKLFEGTSVVGFHAHFVSADCTFGGHILDFVTGKGEVSVTRYPEFFLQQRSDQDYCQEDMAVDLAEALHKIENSSKKS